jgi:2-polyprenyl-3-methyl-5-hydroxy-6-metoxy-1,4-benzoquinol methylase
MTTAKYNEKYWKYQAPIGEFGGWANLTKFTPFLNTEDVVLDFGCGGGFLLNQLPQRRKGGVEINPIARTNAMERGLVIYASTAEVPDDEYTAIISNHALEHCLNPLEELI